MPTPTNFGNLWQQSRFRTPMILFLEFRLTAPGRVNLPAEPAMPDGCASSRWAVVSCKFTTANPPTVKGNV